MEGLVNKPLILGMLCFAAGLATGGAGMYFYSKRYFEEKSASEKQELAIYYANKYERPMIKEESKDEEGIKDESNEEEQTSEVQTEYEKISDIYKTKESGNIPTADSNYFDGNSSGSSSKKKKGGKKKKLNMEVVDQEVWDENPGGFDSAFLIYYDVDGVIVDEESEKIFDNEFDKDDISNILEEFDSDISDTVIVQSNMTKTLYHVTIDKRAYNEALIDD